MAGFLDFIFTTPRQKEERERRAIQQQVVGGAAGGLLEDPTNVQNQTQFATDILGVLPQQGSALLSGIFGDESAGERNAASIEGAGERTDAGNLQSGSNAALAGLVSLTNAELAAATSRANSQDRLSGAAAAQAGGIPGIEFGPVATGMARVMTPGGPQDIGLPGGAPHNTARDQLRKARQSATTVDKIQTLIKDEGFDMLGASRGQFDFLRTSLQGELTELLNLGVINSPAEMERVMELAPDASTVRKLIGNLGVDAADNAINAKYDLLFDLMDDKYNEFATRYAQWPGLTDLLPQGAQ